MFVPKETAAELHGQRDLLRDPHVDERLILQYYSES